MKINLLAVTLALVAFGVLADPTTQLPSVTLAWDRSVDASVNSYRIYYGVAPRAYTNSIPVSGASNTNLVVPNLVRGVTYFFAATCVATNGLESAYSAEVTYTTIPLPLAPTRLTLTPLQL